MDTGKPKPIRVGLRTEGALMHEVSTDEGAPLVPVIGGKPDRKTQNIPLLDLLARINLRKTSTVPHPESADEA